MTCNIHSIHQGLSADSVAQVWLPHEPRTTQPNPADSVRFRSRSRDTGPAPPPPAHKILCQRRTILAQPICFKVGACDRPSRSARPFDLNPTATGFSLQSWIAGVECCTDRQCRTQSDKTPTLLARKLSTASDLALHQSPPSPALLRSLSLTHSLARRL